MKLPRMPDGLTAAWLTEVLRAQRVLDADTSVTDLRREQIGDGTGMMSELVRLVVTYSDPGSDLPGSYVAKYPSQNENNREIAMSYKVYEREVRYFAELNPLTSAHTPHIYLTEMDGDNFVILMADLSAYRVGDQALGADLADTAAALDELAKLHASFWSDVGALEWVPHIADSYHADNMAALAEVGWPNMCEIFKDYIDPGIAAQGDAFVAAVRELQAAMDTAPITLLHGDFRMENVFFATRDGQAPVAIIDWQGPLLGKGVVDVALLLGQSTRTEVRRDAERELIERYAAGLAASGVPDYSAAEAWQDYELATLYNWVYVAVVAGTLDVTNDRAFAWMSQMVARQTAASLDLNVFRLLP